MSIAEPKSEGLRALYWRDEILQVMFWLQGEGFGDQVDAAGLERFLAVDAEIGVQYLERLAQEGLLTKTGDDGRYALSPQGREVGARVFSDEFADLTKSSHGECGADCWCHSSPEEAEACASTRLDGHDHSH